jgi:prepilin-type processing-associated H-X9-DG protein
MKPRTFPAFTLVELLVVVTIIGMLVALLLPAIQSVRSNAETTQCATNLRELALAMIGYESAKGYFPGYVQRLKRGNGTPATAGFDVATRTVFVRTLPEGEVPVEFSWATMLLTRIERQDIWDQIVAADDSIQPPIRSVGLFICPADFEALAVPDRPALSYVGNTGAWDFDEKIRDGRFLRGDGVGDTANNGVLLNLTSGNRKSSLSSIRDGVATTLLLSENIHRNYDWPILGKPPWFSWLSGDFYEMTYQGCAEQQFGMVWVVSESPKPGGLEPKLSEQQRINGNEGDLTDFRAFFPNFARPASNHNGGVNVAFCDGHTQFMRDNIEYTVYQRLLSANGAKCVDPVDHDNGVRPVDRSHPIYVLRTSPLLSNQDYQ